MEQINASIPLGSYTAADYEKQQFQNLQMESAQEDLNQKKQSNIQQKALREAMTGADTSTPEGQAALVQKVRSISPEYGVKLEKDFSDSNKSKAEVNKWNQEAQNQKMEGVIKHMEIIGREGQTVLDVYQDARTKGLPEEQAIKQAESAHITGLTNMLKEGVIDTDKFKQLVATPFNINNAKQGVGMAMTTKDQLTRKLEEQKAVQTAKDEDARRAETARHNKAEESLSASKLAMQREEMTGAKLTPEAMEQAAEIYNKTGSMPPNLGRGKQGAETISKIANRAAELSKGKSADDIITQRQENKAEQRTRTEIGAREGKIAPRVEEAKQFADIALKASDKVDRSTFRSFNSFLQKGQAEIGNPELRSFQAANNSLINAYSAAIAGGAATVSDKEHAREMLSTADSPEAYKAVVKQMITEANAALKAPKSVMDSMKPNSGSSNKKDVSDADLINKYLK